MVLPNTLTMLYAIREPSPERMNPPDSQNAMAISQGISDANAENAAWNVSTPVIIDAPRPSIATAPSGSGWVMMPAMVPKKMANRCQACMVTPAGGGMTHIAAAMAIQVPSFLRSAPHLMPPACRAPHSSRSTQ